MVTKVQTPCATARFFPSSGYPPRDPYERPRICSVSLPETVRYFIATLPQMGIPNQGEQGQCFLFSNKICSEMPTWHSEAVLKTTRVNIP